MDWNMKLGSWHRNILVIVLLVIGGCAPAPAPKPEAPASPDVAVVAPPPPSTPLEAPAPQPEATPESAPPPTPEARLRQGVAEWNAWRSEGAEPQPVLQDGDFAGLSLEQVNFAGMTLIGCDFQGATLSGADFRGATLRDCRFDGARLEGARFDGAQGEKLVFLGADLTQSHLGFRTLEEVDLSNAIVHQVVGWEEISAVTDLNIYRIVKAPAAFKAWAVAQGAVKRAPHEVTKKVDDGG